MRNFSVIGASSAVIAAVVLAGIGSSACSSESGAADPAIVATAMLGEASDSAHDGELGRLAGMVSGSSSGAGFGSPLGMVDGVPQIALRCDSEPNVDSETICGEELALRSSYSWSDCRMGRGGQGQGRGNGRGGPLSSGSVEVQRALSGFGEDCDSGTTLGFQQTASIDIERRMPSGRSATITGKVASSSEHALGDSEFSETVHVDLSRQMRDADGDPQISVTIGGQLEVAFSVQEAGPQRTFDGTLDYDFGDEGEGKLQLDGVVRLDASACRFPVAGKVTRTLADGSAHQLEYSLPCGAATLDGESIDLGGVLAGQGGRKGAGRRGNGQGDCALD